MTIIRRTNPLGELMSVRQVRRNSSVPREHQMPLDVRTSGEKTVVEAAVPDSAGQTDGQRQMDDGHEGNPA